MGEVNNVNSGGFKKWYEKSMLWLNLAWRPIFAVSIVLAAVAVVVFIPKQLSYFAGFIPLYLPFTLPILMVLISIGGRINELRGTQGWLDLCNYFASGFVTFSIWALVSGENVKQYIWINEQKVLDKSYGVPLIVISFGLLAVCSVVTVLAKVHDNKNTPTKGDGKSKLLTGWQTVQAFFVALSLLALLAPVKLFEDKTTVEARTGKSLELKSFTVSIGYRDPAFDQYIGRSRNPIQYCAIYKNVAAKTAKDAKKLSLKAFRDSEQSKQYVSSRTRAVGREQKDVDIEEAWVVAEADASP